LKCASASIEGLSCISTVWFKTDRDRVAKVMETPDVFGSGASCVSLPFLFGSLSRMRPG